MITDPTVEIRRGANTFKRNGGKEVQGMINRNIEELMASRVLQTGSSLKMKDVKSSGKERLREINKTMRTKKKSRMEIKLQELKEQRQKDAEDGIRKAKKVIVNPEM